MNPTQTDWRRDAACASHDPELFFPVGSAGPALVQLEQARQVCRSCPVRLSCLEWAIHVGANDGIWGGLSEQERQMLRRRRRSGRFTPTDLEAVAETVPTPLAASRLRTLNAANALRRQPGRHGATNEIDQLASQSRERPKTTTTPRNDRDDD